MKTGAEIRSRVLRGLANGLLWRLAEDRVKARVGQIGQCHVCDESIRRGEVYEVHGAPSVLVHLDCYLFWLHLSGAYEPEPTTCASCRRVIPPHAEKTVAEGNPYHARCWDREGRVDFVMLPAQSR